MLRNPFYWILLVIIFTPGLLFFLQYPYKGLTFILISLVGIAYLFHILGKKLKILTYVSFGLALSFGVTHLTIDSLVEVLFYISNAFIVLLLNFERSFRNYFYINILSLLNLVLVSINFQNFLYGILLIIYLYLLLYLFLLLAVKGYKALQKDIYFWLLKYSGLIFSGIFVLGVLIFLLVPRPEQPIIALFHKNSPTISIGYNNIIKLGAFSSIADDNTVVFRAKLSKPVKDLYWRGNTLEIFRKGVWISYKGFYASYRPKNGTDSFERPIREEILINPYGGKTIFVYLYPVKVLNATTSVVIDKTRGILEAEKFFDKPLKVYLESSKDIYVNLKKKSILLEVPKDLKPTLWEIISKYHLKSEYLSTVIRRLKKYFSTFRYSKANKAKNLVEFLKVYKEGNCEYFATASALLLRELGFPTRVVVGFHGGDYNPITGFYVIKQKDAHAWVEIYYNNTWIRFDATKYVFSGNLNNKNQEKVSKEELFLLWDTLNTFWLEYVINFNKEKQKTLWKKLLDWISNPDIKVNGFYIVSVIALISLILLVLFVKRKFPSLILSFYLLYKYRIRIKPSLTPIEVYIFLWQKYPMIWQKEKNNLYKLYIRRV